MYPTHDRVCSLGIDAGGSYFKAGLVDLSGSVYRESLVCHSVNSEGTREEILGVFRRIIADGTAWAMKRGCFVEGIGIATPGPFNTVQGFSLMRHKFPSLFGVDLADAIAAFCQLPGGTAIRFIHDVHAFLLGEMRAGKARGRTRVGVVTLGTGLGFGCSVGGRLRTNGIGGPEVSLFRMPHGDGVLEDRISRHGILAAYQSLSGEPMTPSVDVQHIAQRARIERDPNALQVFRDTGRILAASLAPVCNQMEIECLVFGGQISRAYDLLLPGLERLQEAVPSLNLMYGSEHIQEAPIIGAATLLLDAQTATRSHVC